MYFFYFSSFTLVCVVVFYFETSFRFFHSSFLSGLEFDTWFQIENKIKLKIQNHFHSSAIGKSVVQSFSQPVKYYGYFSRIYSSIILSSFSFDFTFARLKWRAKQKESMIIIRALNTTDQNWCNGLNFENRHRKCYAIQNVNRCQRCFGCFNNHNQSVFFFVQ